MMFEERAPSPCFDDGDLSKDFGLDITVSDGGLVTSAANQRQYRSECSRIYQQFILNMTDYINEESQLKRTLNLLQSQQKKSSGKSGKCRPPLTPKSPEVADEDAFTAAQIEEFQNILNHESSRSKLSHASGFTATGGTYPVDGLNRGQTPKQGFCKSISSLVNQPAVSHMFPALKERPPSVKANQLRRDSKSAAGGEGGEEKKRTTSASAFTTDIEYEGIMESNTELSNNRRIRMNPNAFTKLMTGQVKVKLFNKKGDFVLTPMSFGATVLTPEETEKQLMDNKERVALVKQQTTFQSPTLSSDLKISNLVAIQKALKGQPAKRITVGEVMKSARDRRARLFRVQMSGNRFDEFDQATEDLGYVHEIKAANDLGEDIPDSRPQSRGRVSQLNILRQQEQRQEFKLRSPSPIPLHILDPRAATAMHASKAHVSGVQKQVAAEVAGLAVHKDSSEFDHRFNQAVNNNKPKDRQKQVSVIQLGFDKTDSHSQPCRSGAKSSHSERSVEKSCHAHTGVFPVSQNSRVARSKSAFSAPVQRSKRSGLGSAPQSKSTPRVNAGSPPPPPVKKIHSMRDTASIVRRWQEDDRTREEKLNRWRMRMSFAATRRGNLAKVLTRAKSGH